MPAVFKTQVLKACMHACMLQHRTTTHRRRAMSSSWSVQSQIDNKLLQKSSAGRAQQMRATTMAAWRHHKLQLSDKGHAKLSLAGTAPQRHTAFRWLPRSDYSDCRFAHLHIGCHQHLSPHSCVGEEAECPYIDRQRLAKQVTETRSDPFSFAGNKHTDFGAVEGKQGSHQAGRGPGIPGSCLGVLCL